MGGILWRKLMILLLSFLNIHIFINKPLLIPIYNPEKRVICHQDGHNLLNHVETRLKKMVLLPKFQNNSLEFGIPPPPQNRNFLVVDICKVLLINSFICSFFFFLGTVFSNLIFLKMKSLAR